MQMYRLKRNEEVKRLQSLNTIYPFSMNSENTVYPLSFSFSISRFYSAFTSTLLLPISSRNFISPFCLHFNHSLQTNCLINFFIVISILQHSALIENFFIEISILQHSTLIEDKLNFHKLTGCHCQNPERKRVSTSSETEYHKEKEQSIEDGAMKFRTVRTWRQEMAKLNTSSDNLSSRLFQEMISKSNAQEYCCCTLLDSLSCS
ncbi:uncharacterized protein LOC130805847 isoform X2 [Amaranthus tricolor]|uniref:uncharacterized protein LOC130805847 isoform X2 n=1 Tax=Amaranthus tricolor TaxID=29722 RepID=UPI002583F723|nr:uncharacterized protein LOC130805847 isoform X2 [Amaranthus tricolor]